MPQVEIHPGVVLDESDFTESFARASGPGGQNVNKVSTAVEIRLHLERCQSIPLEAKARLHIQQAGRINKLGELVIFAQTHRSQDRNRSDARSRLGRMIEQAMAEPTPRKPTKPSKASHARRLEAKRRRSLAKAGRGRPEP